MYFNRKNTEQKNWRMIKKGKHFLFGCSLVLAIGAVMAAPSVKADEADATDAMEYLLQQVKMKVLRLHLEQTLQRIRHQQEQLQHL